MRAQPAVMRAPFAFVPGAHLHRTNIYAVRMDRRDELRAPAAGGDDDGRRLSRIGRNVRALVDKTAARISSGGEGA
ncbi:MAG: hypothetical protein BGN89_09080 [Alphaproteobacteria bacterium 64-6]|nr:MAG: hypothetical protein BGN89_09080 [Alphaproteobacteria bacterium 64-6]